MKIPSYVLAVFVIATLFSGFVVFERITAYNDLSGFRNNPPDFVSKLSMSPEYLLRYVNAANATFTNKQSTFNQLSATAPSIGGATSLLFDPRKPENNPLLFALSSPPDETQWKVNHVPSHDKQAVIGVVVARWNSVPAEDTSETSLYNFYVQRGDTSTAEQVKVRLYALELVETYIWGLDCELCISWKQIGAEVRVSPPQD